ncbi:MAG: IclR family transcriptional regulator, partial [Pseudomonadota bacterium]
PQPRHRNPAIERMAEIIAEIEGAGGLDLAAITRRTGVSRSSAYRILRSLEDTGFVRRTETGLYTLGTRFFALGEAVARAFKADVLPNILREWLDALAEETRETVRLSAYDNGAILLIAAAVPQATHALGFVLGHQVPLHAGGASKVLLAHLPQETRRRLLADPLAPYTDRTHTNVAALEADLVAIRERGWGHDPGEYSPRVQSYAMPLRRPDGAVIAAVSIAFAATDNTAFHDRILKTMTEQVPVAEALIARS